ncbi:SDH family Clp fold serine proteinase [Aliiroseovarius marinus]|uniref:SDH family Clp fold serine proteinase n=1 Tax=Aliiroseovarius marinus TaxID=2500159 RepID=UPI003D7D416A
MDTIRADEVINSTLCSANAALGNHFDADVVSIFAPMTYGVDDLVRNEVEHLSETHQGKKNSRLVVILETNGGYVEVVERIVRVFRRHYKTVEFVIPNHAFSAGTILALSGDEIHMDYFSVLGPIDPQFPNENGRFLPGLGYLTKYNDLVEKINDPAAGGTLQAEIAFLLKKFDPAQLFHIEQSIEHSKALITEWLPKHKFKNWKVTEANGTKVTPKMRRDRAEQIATVLGDASKWHSHGRGISLKELQAQEIGLKVEDFSDDAERSSYIRHYAGLLKDYMEKLGMDAAVHTEQRLSGT